MLPIPPHPLPAAVPAWAYVAAGAGIVVGLALVLAGCKLARVFMVVVGAGAGFFVAAPVAERIAAPLDVTRGVMVFCLATVALVTSRIAWAALAAAVVAAVVGGVLLALFAPAGLEALCAPAAGTEDALHWATQRCRDIGSAVESGFRGNTIVWIAGVGVGAAVVFLVGLLWPRPTQVVMTTLLGVLLLTAGGVLLVAAIRRDAWDGAFRNGGYVLAGAGGLALIGLIAQSWQAARGRRAAGGSGGS